jgi:cytochrome P450
MPDTHHAQDFIPQTVIPPEKPLPLIRGLRQMIANPLHVWPRAMYENPYHGVKWIGRTFHYFRKPEHMKAVFLDHADIFRKSQFQKKLVGPALGDGLLTAEGEHWKFQRRAASPAFRIDALRALVPAFSTSAQETVARILAMPPGQTVDMMKEMQHATLDVIVETILGGADPNFGYSRVAGTVEDYMQVMGKPDVLDLFGAPPWLPRPWGGKGRRAAAALRASATNAIARRRASGETRNDLLGLLLAARDPETGRGFSDVELCDNVVTFIGAGHETTALTLAFAMYLIANTPDVQDRLFREVQDVCGQKPIDAAMLEDLVYHEQVIKEAMRLYPPVSLIDRVATQDIEFDGVQVKKGDFAFNLIYVMHRHATLWENPSHFDPERFSPENAKRIHRFQFMPFGAGPRICIGMKFAYMEAVAILATLVRSLRFLPNAAHKIEPNIRITLRPEGGMPLYVERR